jgi:hypothetical protein
MACSGTPLPLTFLPLPMYSLTDLAESRNFVFDIFIIIKTRDMADKGIEIAHSFNNFIPKLRVYFLCDIFKAKTLVFLWGGGGDTKMITCYNFTNS